MTDKKSMARTFEVESINGEFVAVKEFLLNFNSNIPFRQQIVKLGLVRINAQNRLYGKNRLGQWFVIGRMKKEVPIAS